MKDETRESPAVYRVAIFQKLYRWKVFVLSILITVELFCLKSSETEA